MNVISQSAILLAICQSVQSASNCIELMSESSFGLFCASYSGSLPPYIPIGKRYSKLQIESANFPYGGSFLSKENFTGLESLTYLRITSSSVEGISPDAFFNLKQLTHIDLSKNRLTYIEPGTFRGLKLKKLILSGNIGLRLPGASFAGAQIFNFVAKDCDIHSISYELFKQTGTKHISLVNNGIRKLSEDFSALIMPSDGSWGSVDLSNNSLVCDCALLWLARLLEKQRRYMDDMPSELIGARSIRYPREMIHEEVFKPMHQLDLTCSKPKNLVLQRFPLPSEFDCPAPKVTGIDISVIGKTIEAVQLTCHARGHPTPSVAWAFKQHNQEVHRIVKSPTKSSSWNGDHAINVSISLNVSLREFKARDFSCIAWTDLGSNKPKDTLISQDNWLNGSPSSSSSTVPRGPLSPDTAHHVGIRLSGLYGDDLDLKELLKESATDTPVASESDESSIIDSANSNPYQQLFIRRFTTLDLIGAIFGTFVTTLILLCIIARCIPYYYHRKDHSFKLTLLQSERKRVLTPFLLEENKNEADIVEPTKVQLQQESTYFAEAPTMIGSTLGPAYWPVQDYAYSTHEYDVPSMADPLSGAMPLSPHPMIGASNDTGTRVRKGRPMSTVSLRPSALQTPYQFSPTSTTGLVLPPVATVPPLGVVTSPFLSYATIPQQPIYFGPNHQLSLSALPNNQLLMTPPISLNVNNTTSQQPEEPGLFAKSSVSSRNFGKCSSNYL